MKLVEKILIGIALIGILFKIQHWPGGGPLLVLSLTILSLIYYVLSFSLLHNIRLRSIFSKNAYVGTSKKTILFAIIAGLFCLAPLVIGIMFRFQFWPGSEAMLLIPLVPSLLLLIIALFKHHIEACKQFLLRGAPLFVFSLSLYLITEPMLIKLINPDYLPVYKAKKTVLDLDSKDEYNRKVNWLENKYYYSMMGGIPNQAHAFTDSIYKTGHETYQIILNQDNDTLFQSAKDFDHMEILDLNSDGYEDFTTYDLDGNALEYIFDPNIDAFVNK